MWQVLQQTLFYRPNDLQSRHRKYLAWTQRSDVACRDTQWEIVHPRNILGPTCSLGKLVADITNMVKEFASCKSLAEYKPESGAQKFSKCQTPSIWKKQVAFKWIFRWFYAFWEPIFCGNWSVVLVANDGCWWQQWWWVTIIYVGIGCYLTQCLVWPTPLKNGEKKVGIKWLKMV